MDANKLKVLEEVYTVFPVCGLCRHGDFGVSSDWGTCRLQQYDHLKHSESTRQLSVNRHGGCERFEADPIQVAGLGKFAQFLDAPQ